MINLIIGSVLLGAILGRFFNVLVLAPAFALSLAMVVASSAYFGHSLPRALLEFLVLITNLQIGYASGLLSHFDSECSRNAGYSPLRPRPEPLHQPAPRANFPYDIADANDVTSGEHVGFRLPRRRGSPAPP